MRTTRMIGEAVNDDVLNDIVARMREQVDAMQGILGHSILVEEGGRMVILIADSANREECLAYQETSAYRQLVASTQHLLVGNYVVKIFRNRIMSRGASCLP